MRSAEKTNVCFLLGGSKLSGAEKRIILTAIELSTKENFVIKLITSNSLRDEFYKSDIKSETIGSLTWKVERLSRSKITFLRRSYNFFYRLFFYFFNVPFRNAVVHIVLFDLLTPVLSLVPRMMGNSKFIYEITSPDVAVSRATKTILKLPFLYDAVVCVSETVKSKLLDGGLIDRGVVLTRKQPFVFFRKKARNFDKENVVVYAHRLVQRKNPLLLTRVFSSLAKEYPNWGFYICGSGQLEDEVKDLVRKNKQPNLLYLGYVYDMDSLLARSKIFVSLIQPDNYPSQSVFNAMANGNALVVSDTGYSSDKFINGNGFAVSLDEGAIGGAIKELLKKPCLQEERANSISLFESEYGVERYIDECVRIYKET